MTTRFQDAHNNNNDSFKELEDLVTLHTQISTNIFNKINSLIQAADKTNSSSILVPTELLKFLVKERTTFNDLQYFNQNHTQFAQSNNNNNNNNTNNTNNNNNFISNNALNISNIESKIGKSKEEPSTSSRKKSSIFSSKVKTRSRREKSGDFSQNIKKMDFSFNTIPSETREEKNISVEEKIRKRFSIKSNQVIRSFGLSPNFLLYNELDRLPDIKLTKLTVNRALTHIKGPGESSQQIMSYGEYASAVSVSNYPKLPGRPYGEGDPICDRFNISLFENRVVMSLADGCNWGDLSRKAAKRATKKFNQFISSQYKDISSIRSAASVILAAFAEADRSIRNNMNELGPPPGSTTLIGGLLAEIDGKSKPQLSPRNVSSITSWDGSPWVFIFASVGDCKCYHYSISRKKLTDLTTSSRSDVMNGTNPGGRLGGPNQADLENLMVTYCPCDDGDFILLLTDGMYDNFDPIQQGKSPSDFGFNIKDWKQVDKQKLQRIVDDYIVQFIEREMIAQENPQLRDIVTNCTNFVVDFTTSSRNFMLENPKSKLPSDLKLYPGKLDHTTCASIKVGKIGLSYNDWVGNSNNNNSNNNNNTNNNSSINNVDLKGTSPQRVSQPRLVPNVPIASHHSFDDEILMERNLDAEDITESLSGSYQTIRKFTNLFD